MKCPYCGSASHRVTDKRETASGDSIRRRRECTECGKRFTTFERIETPAVMVIKKDGTREPFDRTKILRGIMKAVEKRPVGIDQIEAMADSVEAAVRRTFDREVNSSEIGSLIIEELKNTDKVAYIRFASVYKDFKDVESFEAEIHELLNRKQP